MISPGDHIPSWLAIPAITSASDVPSFWNAVATTGDFSIAELPNDHVVVPGICTTPYVDPFTRIDVTELSHVPVNTVVGDVVVKSTPGPLPPSVVITGAGGGVISTNVTVMESAADVSPAPSVPVTSKSFVPDCREVEYDHVVWPAVYVTPVVDPLTFIVTIELSQVPVNVRLESDVVKLAPAPIPPSVVITGAGGGVRTVSETVIEVAVETRPMASTAVISNRLAPSLSVPVYDHEEAPAV